MILIISPDGKIVDKYSLTGRPSVKTLMTAMELTIDKGINEDDLSKMYVDIIEAKDYVDAFRDIEVDD